MMDHHSKNIIRKFLQKPQWQGVSLGTYEVKLSFKDSRPVTLDVSEAILFHQVDRILQSIVRTNRPAVGNPEEVDDSEILINIAWKALAPAREKSFEEGTYEFLYEEGNTVLYTLSSWDSRVLKRYDELLDKIALHNSNIINQIFRKKRAA